MLKTAFNVNFINCKHRFFITTIITNKVSAEYVGVSSYDVVFLNKFIILTNNLRQCVAMQRCAT